MTQFDKRYQALIKKILDHGIEELNERTGHKTKALFGENLELDLEKEFPLLTLRRIPIRIFVAEQIWFIAGANKPDDFLAKFTRIWHDFMEEDGTVAAAYGYRWRVHFGRDQLKQLYHHLKAEPHSRQGVLVWWDPADDGLYGKGLKGTYKKNAPCPFSLVVNILNKKLYFHLAIRSSDTILGLPHDVGGFALLSYILAAKFGLPAAKLVVSITNAHIYDIHYQVAKELIKRTNDHKPVKFISEKDYFERAEKKDESLVYEICDQLKSQYRPLKKIKGLKIVL